MIQGYFNLNTTADVIGDKLKNKHFLLLGAGDHDYHEITTSTEYFYELSSSNVLIRHLSIDTLPDKLKAFIMDRPTINNGVFHIKEGNEVNRAMHNALSSMAEFITLY